MTEREQAAEAAIQFAKAVLSRYWPECNDIDGADIFEMARKSGIIVQVPGGYNPEIHGEAEYDASPGDDWYVTHPEIEK